MDIAAGTPLPARLNPGMTTMWNACPVPRHPHVVPAVMSPVAAHPDGVLVGTVPTILVAERGWSVADDSVALMPVMIAAVIVPSTMVVPFVVTNRIGLHIEAGMG